MKTRDGRDVRIFCADGGGMFPIMGAVKTEHAIGGYLRSERWDEGGEARTEAELDIHPDSLSKFQAAIAALNSRSGASDRPVDGLPRTARDGSTSGDSSERRQPSQTKREPVSTGRALSEGARS